MALTFLLPLLCCVLLVVTFATSFAIAVCLHHVNLVFPYISDTGAKPPESCIFSQLLNIAAVIVGVTVYVRYRHIVVHGILPSLNVVGLWLGLLAAFGVSIVGNFQEVNVLTVHVIGAVMAFGLGSLYSWLQTFVTVCTTPHLTPRYLCLLRAFFSLVNTVGFVLTYAFGHLAKRSYTGTDPRKWGPDDGGWTEHLVSTSAEWVMALAFLLFFLTFIGEFRSIEVKSPEVNIVVMETPPPNVNNYDEYTERDNLLA